ASGAEQLSFEAAVRRECERYRLSFDEVIAAHHGEDPLAEKVGSRRWWDYIIVGIAFAVFVYLATLAKMPEIHMNYVWMFLLSALALVMLVIVGYMLHRYTRFS
ncbi:MAG TPA: hypothetical protein V6C72_18465, partial [Chroococcales cyanobacterium]